VGCVIHGSPKILVGWTWHYLTRG